MKTAKRIEKRDDPVLEFVCQVDDHRIYKLIKDSTFKKMFSSLNPDLKELCLTSDDLLDFCKRSPEHLKADNGNFFFINKGFLVESENEYVVVHVLIPEEFFTASESLSLNALPFENNHVWRARDGYQVIVYQPLKAS